MILIDTEFPKSLLHTTNKIFSGIHYRVRHKIKNDYLWWFKTIELPKVKDLKDVNLHFTFTFGKGSRLYDCDNCSFMGKMITDCLVSKGIFKDDTSKYINSVTYKSVKGEKNHIKLTIL